jgi:integrase/recombinase XerC
LNNLSRFLDYLTFEKRFSSHTIQAYETDLKQYASFLQEQYQSDDLAGASHFIIRSWIVSLIENKVDARSVARKITTLRTFYKFLVRTAVIERTPMLKVLAPKVPKKLPEYIDQTRMETLSEQEIPVNDFVAYRDWFLVDFLYRTGVRRAELIGLKVADVNLYSMTIRVTGKRNKMRQIPMTHSFRDEIKKYLELRKDFLEGKGGDNDWFFIGNSGNQITPNFVYLKVKAAISLVSTGKKRSPHVLRHSFATAMLNNGADINSIKELLGHSSLAATQVYTHNSIEKLREVYRRAFPKA